MRSWVSWPGRERHRAAANGQLEAPEHGQRRRESTRPQRQGRRLFCAGRQTQELLGDRALSNEREEWLAQASGFFESLRSGDGRHTVLAATEGGERSEQADSPLFTLV